MATIENLPVRCEKIDEIVEQCNAYRQQLIEYCMHYLKVYEDSQDCVSFAYVTLIEQLQQGKEISNPKAWLYKVALNKAIQMKKSSDRLKQNDYPDDKAKQEAMENSTSYNPDYVEIMIDDNQINRCAVKILESLTSDEYKLYDKYYRKGKSLGQIAAEMAITPTNARKRHQRLKEKLKRLIDEADENYYKEGDD